MVDDLEQVMLGVLENHEDAFVFENDLDQIDDVWVGKFGTQSHLTTSGLRYASVLDHFTFLVWLEPKSRLEWS